MNGIENLESARKYFAQSLQLNSKNMRSLYGFFMVLCNIFTDSIYELFIEYTYI